MKLNHFICPTCGHDFYVEGSYSTCDDCQCHFYASQSKTCKNAKPMGSCGYPFTYDQSHVNNHFTIATDHHSGSKY
jgi:hypothetical protein